MSMPWTRCHRCLNLCVAACRAGAYWFCSYKCKGEHCQEAREALERRSEAYRMREQVRRSKAHEPLEFQEPTSEAEEQANDALIAERLAEVKAARKAKGIL